MYDLFSFLGLITRVLRGFDRPPVYGMVWMIDLPAKAACSCNFWSKQSDTKLKLREVTARASGHTASVELSSVGGTLCNVHCSCRSWRLDSPRDL